MVDTVKIELPIASPLMLEGDKFHPITLQQLMSAKPGAHTKLVPSRVYKKSGTYLPRLTVHKRISKMGTPIYFLGVEFSAPKLVYGNNFDELVEDDREALLDALQRALEQMVGFRFPVEQLARAAVRRWDVSKNIVYRDYTSCLTVLNTIMKLDVSRVYDFQKTSYRDGQVAHIHCNSLDIAFYDKLADLRQAKKSEKRAIENDSLSQMKLLENISGHDPFEVLRYEVRLNGRDAIKRAYPELGEWTLETMFRKDLSQWLLMLHWQKLTSSLDMLALDASKPYELLQNYLISNPDTTPQAAMSAVTGLLINGQRGARQLRTLLENKYGAQAWYRYKPLLKMPTPNRYKHINHVTESLIRFTPIRVADYSERIE